ncbi:YggT family protein [Azospirillum sp. ST 5-10]|uniref:YggT family protein n=1 Tax=unclassified Azospirillum TaxID=2630922 RepID=UPI003F4A29F9
MQTSDFFLAHLPFWIATYALAVVGWTCLGRFLLGLFVPPDSPLYIWRAFRLLTDWALRAAAAVTPRGVPPVLLAPIAALWVFVARVVLSVAMLASGLAPTLGPAAGAG